MRLRTTLCASLALAACNGSTSDLVDLLLPDAGGQDAQTASADGAVDVKDGDAGQGGGLDAAARDAGSPPVDAGSVDVGAASVLFPTGFSVTSPLAQQRRVMRRIDPNMAVTPAERSAQLASVLGGKVLDDCTVMLSQLALMGSGDNVTCYGPQLDYTGHPDGTPASGQLPGGDLGLWRETEARTGEACAAAKLNALVSSIGRRVDFGLYASASMVCTGRLKGLIGAAAADDAGVPDDASVDDAGARTPPFLGKLDLKSDLAAVLAADGALAVGEASIERITDAEGEAFKYVLELTVTPPAPGGGGGGPAPSARTIRTELLHVVDPVDSGSYRGRIWSRSGSGAQSEAYSVAYAKNALTGRLRYHTVSASFDAGHVPTFDADGQLRIDSDWSGNATQGIFDMSASDGTGSVSFAWQAGSGDSHARVFHAFTEASSGATTGCGYFAYGSRFDKSAPSWPDNEFSTFICNWAGPGNNHAGRSGYAQKQCMELDPAGLYTPTTSNLSYAPVNACDSTSTSFTYKLTSEPSYTTAPLVDGLVKLADDADYTRYDAPATLF
jgi:hypothetical protein